MMVTKNEIDIICTKKYVNSSLCYDLLKSIPKISTLDFNGLTKFLIKYQSQNISDALNQIQMSAGNATDLQTIDLCVRLYENTLYDTDHILKALAAKKYFNVNIYITENEIDIICTKKYVNSSLCYDLLKSIPKISTLDFNGLTKFLIKYQSRNVSDALNQIQMSAGNATDLQTIDLCVRLYENTLYDTDHILKALTAKKYFNVNIYITGLDANMGTCREELVVMKPRLEVLITRNKQIKMFEGNTTGADLKAVQLFEELYDDSLFHNDRALKVLATKDYDSLNIEVGFTLAYMDTCNDGLSTMKPTPQVIITKNSEISSMSSIILVILECFLRKVKIRC
ncbi:hypothetical protein YC2023_100642 [Brassica napus]